MNLRDASIIELPKIQDHRGNLSFLENSNQIPFEIARVYWIYDVPGGESRGSHAFYQTDEVIIALSGSFDVWLDDGKENRVYTLNRSYKYLFVPRMTYRKIDNFSTNSLALVVASKVFDPKEYIRDYDRFLRIKNGKEQ